MTKVTYTVITTVSVEATPEQFDRFRQRASALCPGHDWSEPESVANFMADAWQRSGEFAEYVKLEFVKVTQAR